MTRGGGRVAVASASWRHPHVEGGRQHSVRDINIAFKVSRRRLRSGVSFESCFHTHSGLSGDASDGQAWLSSSLRLPSSFPSVLLLLTYPSFLGGVRIRARIFHSFGHRRQTQCRRRRRMRGRRPRVPLLQLQCAPLGGSILDRSIKNLVADRKCV